VPGAFGHFVGSGTKQLQAEETLEAIATPSVDVPMQFLAQLAVPVAENAVVVPEVKELQKPSKLSRLAVNCLLKALAQLLPPQLGGLVGFGGGAVVQTDVAVGVALLTYLGLAMGALASLFFFNLAL